MRITGRPPISKLFFVAAALSIMALAGSVGLRAGSSELPFRPRVGLSLASGAFRADQDSFRALYGAVQAPFHGQVDVFLTRKISLFAGFRYLRKKGFTQIVGPVIVEEHHPLEFAVSSARAGIGFRLPARRFAFHLGIGGSFSQIRERWLDLPLDKALKGAGLFVNLGAGFEISRRWEIFARLEYSTLPTDLSSALEPMVNLAGTEAVLGLMFKL